jgi:hypothetical protein
MSKATDVINLIESGIYNDVEKIGGTVRLYHDGGLNTTMWAELKGTELQLADKLLTKFRKRKDLFKPGCPENKLGSQFKPRGENREYYAFNIAKGGIGLYLVAYDNRAEKGGYAWYLDFYKEN